ncbi:extracellular solute-binding protein [Methylovirgula sp. 4M-Z18]|uniref:extracellular solute-binding protein n=1 Tax=Methylovirgula sp. 4M-Z18 TaxID=2293567 RepID=UPI000E2FAF21|nr:extracellular solute-binding protein [Methylovirgula sp. 4M-Z18]RFB79185.1 ABC transporter substrate-binding protein [Methylovirgula sp. 4M-Z18]
MTLIDRRSVLKYGSALGASLVLKPAFAADGDVESHGLSIFGDLALPSDFKHFAYVNPDAPKGGKLVMTVLGYSGNESFETFDTLNSYVLKGAGAAGMSAIYDSLMAGTADEPNAAYGLVAQKVKVSKDKLTYRFFLRPEARFHDGSKLTAKDVAFSLNILKEKGHPNYHFNLIDMAEAVAETDDVVRVQFVPKRSRDAHMYVVAMPIFPAAYWATRDFEASTLEPPLGSGAYKVGNFEQGRFIEFDRVDDYWAKDLPVNVGANNFSHIRFEYFRDRQIAFEGFKAGRVTYWGESTSKQWHTGFDFPAFNDGKVKKETLPNNLPASCQTWNFNTRRDKFKDSRVREAIGLCFDFEWTNKNIMYSSFTRTTSYFPNSPNAASGKPSPAELALLEPWRGKAPDEVFGEPYLPPVSDGSGSDRALLQKANQLLLQAGCKRDGDMLKLPDGSPLEIEFLDSTSLFEPIQAPFIANLRKLGIRATSRAVDAAQHKRRTDSYDFDIVVTNLGRGFYPGADLRSIFTSHAADTPGSLNLSGISDPAIDAIVERIATTNSKDDLQTSCRVLDRLLRAGRYSVFCWYRADVWLAYWDAYARPATQPKFGTGAPDTWWWDDAKAKQIGMSE